MNNKELMLNIIRASVKEETLEQLAERVSKASKEEQEFRQRMYCLIEEPSPTTSQLDETEEAALKQIVTHAAQESKPEQDTEFLVAIPDLHLSWFALKVISENPRLQEVYAVIMMAIHQGQIPLDAETRILCLDKVDKFAQTLNRHGQEWSRRAQTIMRKQHPDLYDRLFDNHPVYFTFD